MRNKRQLTQEFVKQYIDYNPLTGKFTKLKSPQRPVGSTSNGYLRICIKGTYIDAQNLAFLIMTGTIPNLVDHKNKNKLDNRWNNLRAANKQLNGLNRDPSYLNTSGYVGVSYNKRQKKWKSYVHLHGRQISLGSFSCPTAAHLARLKKENRLWKLMQG